MNNRVSAYALLLVRCTLAAAFLAAVTDRFGWWGPPGAPNVAWVTVLESGLALGLIFGVATRWVALASGVLLLLFALAMTAALGIKAPLNYSVFSASCEMARTSRLSSPVRFVPAAKA